VVPAPDETTDWVRPIAAFYLDGTVTQLSNNLAAGSADSGFVLHVPSCGDPSSTNGAFAGNEAHAVMVRAACCFGRCAVQRHCKHFSFSVT
jgi:hypothetical protein